MNPHIRAAVADDVPAMLALQIEAAAAAQWTREQYAAIFQAAEPRRISLIVEVGADVQGFLVARVVDHEWEIENIVVSASARRGGLGARLIAAFLIIARAGNAEAVFLEVRESNESARRLYERAGFTPSGRRPRYYHSPVEDAVVYRLGLSGAAP